MIRRLMGPWPWRLITVVDSPHLTDFSVFIVFSLNDNPVGHALIDGNPSIFDVQNNVAGKFGNNGDVSALHKAEAGQKLMGGVFTGNFLMEFFSPGVA